MTEQNPNPTPNDTQPAPSRRNLLFKVGAVFSAAAGVLMAVPICGFLFSAFGNKKRSDAWITLGELGEFTVGQTRLATYRNPFTRPWDGPTSQIPCWVRRIDAGAFQVFAVNCTHLGCPVRWFQESKLFMCPCHGGVYYQDGARASGPPPRGLFQYDYKVENGQLLIKGGILPTLAEPLS